MNENSQMSTIQVKTQHSKESNALHQLLRSIKSIQSNKTNQQSHSPPNSSPISKDTSFNSSISINSTDRMDMTCPICYERMRDPSKANNCFHMFCFDCIVRWCKQKLVCPLCKVSLEHKHHLLSTSHHIQSDQQYDQYILPIPTPAPLSTTSQTNRRSTRRRPDLWMPPQEQRTVFQRRKKLYTHEIVRVSTTLIPPNTIMDSLLIYNRIKPFVQRELQIIFEDEDMFILTEYISRLLSSHRYIFYPPRQPSSHETQDAQINCYNLWKRDRDFIYSKLYSLFQDSLKIFLSEVTFYLFSHLSLEYYDRVKFYKYVHIHTRQQISMNPEQSRQHSSSHSLTSHTKKKRSGKVVLSSSMSNKKKIELLKKQKKSNRGVMEKLFDEYKSIT